MINSILSYMIYLINFLFCILLAYYVILTFSGLYFRLKSNSCADENKINEYPSVAILIPAYNEGKVLSETLLAMSKLEYAGQLDIYVLNDSSKDNTGEIANFYASINKKIHHILVPDGLPKGKSRVLNYGASITDTEYICVYDADNQPEKNALKYMIEKAILTPNSCGSVGYVKTINFDKNWLTRMIGIEFCVFNLIMQCGRWQLFNIGTYTGTNMVISRTALEEVNFWDVNAIAEDTDLSMSLTAKGYVCPVVPDAITWEQEPESFRVWFKQRVRWMKGNLYIIAKTFKTPSWLSGKALINSLQMISIYILFVSILLISDLFFLLGTFGLIKIINIYVPIIFIWYLSWLVYFIMVLSAIFIDEQVKYKNLLSSFLMYFTYAQLWIVLLIKAFIDMFIKRENKDTPVVWDKTVRF